VFNRAIQALRDRHMLLGLLAIAFYFAISVLPLTFAIIFLAHREYLTFSVALLYGLPGCISLGMVSGPLIQQIRDERANRSDQTNERLKSWGERVQHEVKSAEAEVLLENRPTFWRYLSKLLMAVYAVFMLPLLLLKLVIAMRISMRIFLWSGFFEVCWLVSFILLAYSGAVSHPFVSIILSVVIFVGKLYEVISRFEVRQGVLRMLSYKKHQVRLFDIVLAAVMMVAAFGCIHYCISLLNDRAYSVPLTAFDGFYFSVVTFATVGYGDIVPKSFAAKLACIGEIFSGCLVLLFGVNLEMMVWFQKFSSGPTDSGAAAIQAGGNAVPQNAKEPES